MNWISSKHNMGMSFTRAIWEKIKTCTDVSAAVLCSHSFSKFLGFHITHANHLITLKTSNTAQIPLILYVYISEGSHT